MIADHLERAAIEIHFALADIGAQQGAAASAAEQERTRALLAILRFALSELDWVCSRVAGVTSGDQPHAVSGDAEPQARA
jgi:hypothetical protein